MNKSTRAQKHRRLAFRRQSGAIAILAVVSLILIAGTVLLERAQPARQGSQTEARREASNNTLQTAKQALISHAVLNNHRPGALPCPDENRDGNSNFDEPNPFCNTYLGWLPLGELGLSSANDASGERIWYALSADWENNNNLIALNSNLTGKLGVDSRDDIVAVLIAPGSPIVHDGYSINQESSRPSPSANGLSAGEEVAHFLEDCNALDVAAGVERYATTALKVIEGNECDDANREVEFGTDRFNDQVVFITRQEIMAPLEKRVSGVVKQSLEAYRLAYDTLPPLSPFQDPSSSAFISEIGTSRGHLGFTDTTENWPDGEAFNFPAEVVFDWDLESYLTAPGTDLSTICPGDPTGPSVNLPVWSSVGEGEFGVISFTFEMTSIRNRILGVVGDSADDIRIGSARPAGAGPAPNYSTATCRWTGFQTALCETTSSAFDAGYAIATCKNEAGACIDGADADVSRTISMRFNFTAAPNPIVVDPLQTTRTVSLQNSPIVVADATYEGFITVRDEATRGGTTFFRQCKILLDNSVTPDNLEVANIYIEPRAYDVPAPTDPEHGTVTAKFGDANRPGDLPSWFATQDWASVVYAAYASDYPCVVGTNCLTVQFDQNGAVGQEADLQAVVFLAGEAVDNQDRSVVTVALDDYLENGNEDAGDPNNTIFKRAIKSNAFNDWLVTLPKP